MNKRRYRVLFRRRIVVMLLIVLQAIFLLTMIINGSRRYVWMNSVLTAMSLLVTLHIISRRAKPAYKLTWSVLILLFPIFGGLFYLLYKLQSSTMRLRHIQRTIQADSAPFFLQFGDVFDAAAVALPDYRAHMDYLQHTAGFPVYQNTAAVYYPSGNAMFSALLESVKHAKRYIFIEFFIIQEGYMWDTLLAALCDKAARGVEVRVLYDDMGCLFRLPTDYPKTLQALGIRCAVFNRFRPFLSAKQNNRDHRKIAVIDGTTAFTGGVNLSDEYIGRTKPFGEWRDAAIGLTGNGAWSMALMFLQMWSLAEKSAPDYAFYCPQPLPVPTADGFVQPYADSPMDTENVGEHVYLQLINSAKKYLYICTPYLIIDDTMISALVLSAKSGVDVRIITPHIWDKRVVHMTTRSYYRELIDGGVKIYEYTKGFSHSKTFVSDDAVAVVGTVNLDFRSLYLHFECGVRLYSCTAVDDVKQDFLRTIAHCQQITVADCKNFAAVRIAQDILRLFAPLM